MKYRVSGIILLIFFVSAPDVQAQQPVAQSTGLKTIAATRLDAGESIELDGVLDEAVWKRAVFAGDFVQIDPNNGRPATEQTEVRIAYDSDSIFMGVTCLDSEPDKWLGFQRRRDETLGSDDRFMWTIDTFLDARSGYFFEMNPSGLMGDSLMGINGDNRQWDGIWNARVRRSEIGWTIEIEIPFRTLNFNPNNDTWGFNFQRTVRRKNEDSIWTGWARNQGLRRMTNAGHVTGIRDVSQGHGLDIKPYGVYTSESFPGRDRPSTNDGAVGIDFFYNPTPLLRTNLTINTDFAQTEVDQRQVNLTRFSLFFPEKRDFFLDGATFFDFGSPTAGDNRVNPFFSRRIGLSATNTPQKIDFGTKVTGQIGREDIGLVHVRTGEDDDEGMIGEDFTAARIKHRMFQQSYIGALYTRRDPRTPGGDASHTIGFDSRLATNRFLGSENLEVGAWLLHSANPGVSSGESAFGGWIAYPNDLWNARFDLGEVQENFEPTVGFVARENYRRYNPSLGFAPRPASHPYIRRFNFSGDVEVQTDLKGDLLTRNTRVNVFGVDFHSGDTINVEISPRHERLDEPFDIGDVTLPQGNEYDFTRYQVRAQTANRRVFAFNGRYEVGDFYSGTRSEKVVNLTVRARPGLIVYLTGEWNNITLPEGAVNTRLYRLVGETQFTSYMALVNNIQYDTQSSVLGWQSRFRWIIRPGNDLYVVYTHNWEDDAALNRFATLDRRFSSKVLYTYRY